MRFLYAAAVILFFHELIFPVRLTNTVIPPMKPVLSYKIVSFYLKNDPSIIITRKIKTHSGVFYYYINMDTLRFGLTDEWKMEDFTNIDDGKDRKFTGLKKLQASLRQPFGTDLERFPPDNFTNIVLTSDLCPTSKQFARKFYKSLIKFGNRTGKTVPVVIFFSGRWIEKHPLNLEEIKKYPIDFIAGNHTYSHPVISGGFLQEILTSEATNTERIMLENGILPSYLFRFPGLRHTPSDIACLNSINIIALDANVWMGEHVSNWNVLLVHSNGNALTEVDLFTNFIELPGNIIFSDIFSYMNRHLISNNK